MMQAGKAKGATRDGGGHMEGRIGLKGGPCWWI